MKKYFIHIAILLISVVCVTACQEPEVDESIQKGQLVNNVLLPTTTFYTSLTPELTIQGKGFEDADKLTLIDSNRNETEVSVKVIDHNYVTFAVPQDIEESGEFILTLHRGTRSQRLGVLKLRLSPDLNVEDKEDTNIKGVVFCGKEPLAGVVVSDGINVTTTDGKGRYWLQSTKHHGYVFVSFPSGYEPMLDGCIPRLWSDLNEDPESKEQHDFELIKVDNREHVMLAFADMHLANRDNKDLQQFNQFFVQDVFNTLNQYYGGKKVYALNVGDMSWDTYWYSGSWGVRRYDIESYRDNIQSQNFRFPIFHSPGNHDNDPYMTNDFDAEAPYKKFFGPTYYSFNIGDIHYVMLDNIIYDNNGAVPPTIMGNTDYRKALTDIQIEWLKKDLELTDKSKPVIVGHHCPAYYSNNALFLNNTGYESLTDLSNLMNCFKDFTNVHFISGHTHNNINSIPKSTKRGDAVDVYEHNTGAICATWWWTGFLTSGQGWRQIGKDGAPGGYGVYEINGTDIEWYYKANMEPRERQFRSYDMNTVKRFMETNPNAQRFYLAYPDRYGEFNGVAENVVFLNVWNWDEEWKITAKEGAEELQVKRIYQRDPLHVISYDIPNFVRSGTINSTFATPNNVHMFYVQCSNPSSTLQIEIEDRFGNIYQERMLRPKAFSTEMN